MWVVQQEGDAAVGPLVACAGRRGQQSVKPFFDLRDAHIFVYEPMKYILYDRSGLRVGLERAAFFALELDFAVAEGRLPGGVFALAPCGLHTGVQTAADSFIFTAGHEKPEFKILLVVFVVWVKGFKRRDDAGFRVFEGARDNALIDAVAARQTLDLHHDHAAPLSGFHLLQQPLHLRTRGNGVA